MSNWKTVTLADISIGGKGSYGIPAPAIPYSEGKYTYLRITDINDDGTLNLSDRKSLDDPAAQEYLLQPNDIVFARTGNSTGRNYFYDPEDGDLVYAGFLIKFSIDPGKVNPKYIKYYMLSPKYRAWITAFNTGSTRGNINAQTYANMQIDIPPRKQQDLLVDVLSSLDAKIRVNNQINRNLEEQGQILLEHYSQEGLSIKLRDVLSFVNGFAFKSNTYISDGHYKIITIKNVQEGKIDSRDADTVSDIPAKMKQDCFLQEGDILLSLTGNVGRAGIVCEENLLLNQRVAKVIPRDPNLSAAIYFVMRRKKTKDILINISRGTAQANLSPVETLNVEVPFSIESLQRFSPILNGFLTQIIHNEKENQRLQCIRDSLLPKLMSDEIPDSEETNV